MVRDKLAQNGLAEAARGRVRFGVPLSELSYWRIGGAAAAVVEPTDADALAAVRRVLADAEIPSLVVGETSNLLFDSRGFEGVLIRVSSNLGGVEVVDGIVTAGAGASARDVARATADAGRTGLEHIVGIPGTIGGLVVMNGGSQRNYVGRDLVSVAGVDSGGRAVVIDAVDLELGYRTSGLEHRRLAIYEISMRLPEIGDPTEIHSHMDEIIAERARKFPLDLPSCGSTFLSDPAMYATFGTPGRAIEDAGLKGLRRGGAQISPRHANFIVNNGGASSDDVLDLIRTAQESVEKLTGFRMRCEVRYVSPSGAVVAADAAAIG